jgi:hypothetical protein
VHCLALIRIKIFGGKAKEKPLMNRHFSNALNEQQEEEDVKRRRSKVELGREEGGGGGEEEEGD